MKVLGRADILGAQDRKPIRVEVPEWGGVVYVRHMSAAAKDRFDAAARDEKGKFIQELWRARVAAATMVDADGHLLFSEEDVRALGERSQIALDRVVAVANGANAMDGTAIEELAGNSEPVPSGDSSSSSPES